MLQINQLGKKEIRVLFRYGIPLGCFSNNGKNEIVISKVHDIKVMRNGVAPFSYVCLALFTCLRFPKYILMRKNTRGQLFKASLA